MIGHGDSEFFLHQPSSSPFDTDHLRQPKRSDDAFVGVDRDRGLTSVTFTLVKCVNFGMKNLITHISGNKSPPCPSELDRVAFYRLG